MPILLFIPSILIHQSLAVAKSCDWYICKIVYFSQPGKSTKQRIVLLFVTLTKQEANTTIPTTTPPCPEYLCFCSWYWNASHNRSRWRLSLQTPPGDCLTEPQPLLMRRQPVLVTSASAEPSGLKVNLLFFELGRVVFFWQIKCILHFFAAISISNIQLQPKQLIGGEIWVEGSNNEKVCTYRLQTHNPPPPSPAAMLYLYQSYILARTWLTFAIDQCHPRQ